MSADPQAHWDEIYSRHAVHDLSWYEASPGKSLELIRASGVKLTGPIIDVGGGASSLVDALLDWGYKDVTVLDISSAVLLKLRVRLGLRADHVKFEQQEVTAFRTARRYALWHDRAVFHFLVSGQQRKDYVAVLRSALQPNGQIVIATFGPDGPQACSSLPTVRYDATSLAAELGDEFELVDSSLVQHRTPSGASQQFLYCHFRRTIPATPHRSSPN